MDDERIVVPIFLIALVLIGIMISAKGERKKAIAMSVLGGSAIYLFLRLAPICCNS